MSTVIFFGNVRGNITRPIFSPQHLTVAVNLSPSHHLLGFLDQSIDAENNIEYAPYNRFPPVGYMLIKLVTSIFGSNLSNTIYAAKLLMVICFTAAAILAYFSLCRFTVNRWIASSAILIFLSSTMLLWERYYVTIFTEGGPSFLGFVLTFHGMVIFAQEGRFKQLVVKSCVALLLGWHVLALLFPFVLLGFAKEIIYVRKAKTVEEVAIAVVASRYLKLGFIALGFGILIFFYNMGNEFYALNIRVNHQLALSDLPSIRSMLRRTGMAPTFISSDLPWGSFLTVQLHRLSETIIPLGLLGDFWGTLLGIIVAFTCVVGVFLVRHRLLAATAIIAGFCWAIPMRHNTHEHRHEALYYVGISLFFITLILVFIQQKLSSERLLPVASIAALLVIAFSNYRANHAYSSHEHYYADPDLQETIMGDFDAVRGFTEGKYVFVADDLRNDLYGIAGNKPTIHGFWLNYYLNGISTLYDNFDCHRGLDRADFIIQTRLEEVPSLLTTDNQIVFLYDRYVYEERISRFVAEGRLMVPGAGRGFDVYLTDDRKLVYVGDRCGTDSDSLVLGVPISLSIFPVDDADLSNSGKDHEFHELHFIEHFVMDTKRHVVIFDLPDYDIARISMGQYNDEGQIWGGGFLGPDHVYADRLDLVDLLDLEDPAVGKSIIRGRFDVYLTDYNSLIYMKEPCIGNDISEGFFVHVIPVNSRDLPEHRQQYDFDNLDFTFLERGITDGRRCAAVLDLPNYDIAHLRTGQFTDQGPTWQNEFVFTGG